MVKKKLIKNCCNHTTKDKIYKRKSDNKIFNLPRRFSKKRCLKGPIKGFSMRSSCAPFKYCKKSKKKKLKEIAAKKAAQLANRMSEAATLEAQQAVQLQILRLIGFNPDFSAYQNVSITQPQFYAEEQLPDAKIPNSRRGLRNGLAQQLLHEKMVDMQYE